MIYALFGLCIASFLMNAYHGYALAELTSALKKLANSPPVPIQVRLDLDELAASPYDTFDEPSGNETKH